MNCFVSLLPIRTFIATGFYIYSKLMQKQYNSLINVRILLSTYLSIYPSIHLFIYLLGTRGSVVG
jgi:hypothetical protein